VILAELLALYYAVYVWTLSIAALTAVTRLFGGGIMNLGPRTDLLRYPSAPCRIYRNCASNEY
jgi:hypothetical protein